MDEVNVGQHTVPKFYLRLFSATLDHKVYVRERDGTAVRLEPTKNLTVEDNAYSVFNGNMRDTSCDDVNGRVESRTAPLVKSITDKPLTPDQHEEVRLLTANLLARSRQTRDKAKEVADWAGLIVEDMLPTLRKLPPLPPDLAMFGLSPEDLDAVPGDLARANGVLYPMTAALGTGAIESDLRTKGAALLVAPAGAAFITSDDPALIYVGGRPAALELRPGFIARPDVEVLLPLRPGLACLWSTVAQESVQTATAEDVARRNRDLWTSCYRAVFASRRDELDALT
jgi:hypothetical protein